MRRMGRESACGLHVVLTHTSSDIAAKGLLPKSSPASQVNDIGRAAWEPSLPLELAASSKSG